MATRFYYPVFIRLCRHLDRWLSRNQGAMVDLCSITGEQLVQLNELRGSLYNIVGDHTSWPPYKNVP